MRDGFQVPLRQVLMTKGVGSFYAVIIDPDSDKIISETLLCEIAKDEAVELIIKFKPTQVKRESLK